ncbi:MAG TPA: CamS family sex pheromone protein [Firmicutes bacterium]|nr:CamS family sex pheromone protein [Bacillota bacterium]
MTKRFFTIFSLLCSLMLVGCTEPPVPSVSDEDLSQLTPTQQELSNQYTTDYYRTIIPYESSAIRGLVYKYMSNRYDIEEFENALMRHSQSYYSPDEVFFQEGKLLSRDLVISLLASKKTEAELGTLQEQDETYVDYGLNPTTDEVLEINGVTVNPVYLAYLLEQDYVTIVNDGVEVQGISIGLALNPYQTYVNEINVEQTVQMDEEQLIEEGKKIAQQLIDILRTQDGFENMEIMIGLYVLKEDSSVVPGNMVAKTHLSSSTDKIKNWTSIDEKYYLLPDQSVQSVDFQILDQFNQFKDEIKQYYPHYYGVIGVAQYIDKSLNKLEITVNIDFYGLAEKLSFHQLLSKLIEDNFTNQYEITVVVRSTQEVFGLLHRGVNENDITLKLINWE